MLCTSNFDATGGTQVLTAGPNKGVRVGNDAANTTLVTLDLSANVITDKGATDLSNMLARNSCLAGLLLSHNVLRDKGACALEAAVKDNWSVNKLTTEGNAFDEMLRSKIGELVKRNVKMQQLSALQAQNAREFARVRARVQPPAHATGKGPVRFAHKIDVAQNDPALYAALQTAAVLSASAAARAAPAAMMADRAAAVVAAARGGSNRAMLALYRFAAEGGEAVDALVAAGAVPAVVELVAAGAGHGGAHEAAEAMRHCLQTLMLLARASHAVAAALVCELLVLGPLLELLTMDFCDTRHLLDGYVDDDPAGPLAVIEQSARHLWMQVMAQGLHPKPQALIPKPVDAGDGTEPLMYVCLCVCVCLYVCMYVRCR